MGRGGHTAVCPVLYLQTAVIRKSPSPLVYLSETLTHPGALSKKFTFSTCYEFLSSCPKSSVNRNLANQIIHSSVKEELGPLSQASSGRKAGKEPQRQPGWGWLTEAGKARGVLTNAWTLSYLLEAHYLTHLRRLPPKV